MSRNLYPADIEEKIGFTTIRNLLNGFCESNMAKQFVEGLSFSTNYNTIKRNLLQTDEMQKIITTSVDFPLDAVYDVAPYLTEIKAEGAYMSVNKLSNLRKMLYTVNNISRFFKRSKDNNLANGYPALVEEFSELQYFPEIEKIIDSTINDFGAVKDSASENLMEIRRELRISSGAVNKAMSAVIRNAAARGLIDKNVSPVVRDGRLLLPIAAANRRQLNAVVHDQSATGRTIFVEPVEVLEATNRIHQLQQKEKEEIIIILQNIARQIRPEADTLIGSVTAIGKLDFIRAKARCAIKLSAQMPKLEKKPEIDWYNAINPELLLALQKTEKSAVAFNLQLDQENKMLLISGPNAGGKSVALKTIACVQYMTQCGLLPTIYSNSHVGVFDNLFIDIGDQQSIENELSTYSSHLKNMKFFINRADKKTLLLIDEIGSGTEPKVGAAIAQAIVNELKNTGCFAVITTHYQNLKTFAEHADGIINGAMLYDRQNLKPLYQLSVGNAGNSFALEIARNIGLPNSVIQQAKDIVGQDYVDSEKYLMDISRDKHYWQQKRSKIKEKERKLNDLLEKYEQMAAELKLSRNSILKDAKQQAKEIFDNANAKLENTIHEIRKADAEKKATQKLRNELNEYKKSIINDDIPVESLPGLLKPLKHKSRNKKNVAHETIAQSEKSFVINDFVKMKDGNVVGKIINISGKKAEVAFGELRTTINLDKLIHTSEPKPTSDTGFKVFKSPESDNARNRQLNFSTELDVRGMRGDDALQAVTYYLDDALQFSASKVRILHGTGNGILRTLIRELLKSMPAVKSFHDEDVRFGGAGITVVDLD